ncbi:hypothetical protein CPB84DRAFT_1850464 [Gymnopilus junonius]|uniref:Uncharacterized protein n=1 Tax=Gymnopilus junonius TaxID=109634 RepID=A0A9P5NHD0_GYMJU|nr:hypothetical protein CPB84DRAFT_1850464 [Gymnopilus junonius]
MSMVKINLLQCTEETGWPQDHIIALATFYLNLENHPKHQEPDGDTVLLAYQAQVRREWHIQLKRTTGEPAFDISTINDDLVDKIGVKMWNATKTQLVTRQTDVAGPPPQLIMTAQATGEHPLPLPTVDMTHRHMEAGSANHRTTNLIGFFNRVQAKQQ